MTRRHLSTLTLIAGISSLVGCGTPETGTNGSGGAGSGGESGSGGAPATGGTTGGTGGSGTGGSDASGTGGSSGTGTGGAVGSGGVAATGGATGTGGAATGGAGGAGAGGRNGMGGRSGGASGGSTGSGGAAGSVGGSIGTSGTGGGVGTGGGRSGTCTASKATGTNASGSGPHKVTVETNSDPGINEGTIFRPTDLGGTEKYPIFVWGEGGCSQNGLSNSAAMAEIASHGYFVVADGTPNGSGNRTMGGSNPSAMGKPLLAYVDWAIAENEKPCSAYYHSLDTTKIAANGFSCGGLMSEGTAGDSRITTWGVNSSGMTGANQAFYKTIHTPVLIVLGGSGDIAYERRARLRQHRGARRPGHVV